MIRKYIFWSSFSIVTGIIFASFLFQLVAISLPFARSFFSAKASSEINNENGFIETAKNIFINQSNDNKNETEKYIKNGILMFRGNPQRDWYGTGPLPMNPETQWKYPKEKMCSLSVSEGKESQWCGSGWTGQPVVLEKENGESEVIFGAYDGAVHFVDAETGEDLRKPFQTGDIIKGSVTLDPDGFPLLYFGSRDNQLRVLSIENGQEAKELWSLDSKDLHGVWNDDWDGNPVVIDDILYEGAENGWFYAIKLNREFDENGFVKVNPKIIFSMPSYDDELIKKVGRNVSIENSLTFFEDRVYFANSGGRVLGLDIKKINEGIASVVFDYWVGDDVDATIVVDDEGMLYISSEFERFTERSLELGQLIKLNPYQINPYVWSMKVVSEDLKIGGIWATPAWYKNSLFVTTHTGRLLQIDKDTGQIVWEEEIFPHAWSSPVVIDDQLLVATCGGEFLNYALQENTLPNLLWKYPVASGCIESTPIVWQGEIFVGARDGYFYKVGEKK